jgi:hypothetical protein
MSEWYLLNTDHELSSVAVKVAAVNLVAAAEGFGVVPNSATVYLANMDTSVTPIVDERRVKVAGAPMVSKVEEAEKVASAYDWLGKAEEQWADLDPYDRHTIAVDLVKLATGAGMDIPEYIRNYSGEVLNPEFKKIANARKDFTADPEIQEGYDRLSKMAGAMDPGDVIEAMYLLDERAGIVHRHGERIPDPVISVYGIVKEAEYSWTHGGDYVTGRMLERYSGSTSAINAADNIFTKEVKSKFRTDPIGTFKGLPLEQQIFMARLASQSRETNDGGY